MPLFEASGRLGGIVETVRRQGFVIECGPDSWVTEKPWARELAVELGLEDQIVASNDQWRRTYVQRAVTPARLVPIPDGMRMIVPASGARCWNRPVQLAGPACLSAGAKTRRRAQHLPRIMTNPWPTLCAVTSGKSCPTIAGPLLAPSSEAISRSSVCARSCPPSSAWKRRRAALSRLYSGECSSPLDPSSLRSPVGWRR